MSHTINDLAADPGVRALLAKIPRVSMPVVNHPKRPHSKHSRPARRKLDHGDQRDATFCHAFARLKALQSQALNLERKAKRIEDEIEQLRKSINAVL